MDLLKQTKGLCKLYGLNPSRSKGQNFLINNDVYDKIIKTADLKKDDIVLEVGPGLGFLTARLAKKVKKVIAVELDRKLVSVLGDRLKEQGIKNVKVVNENILTLPLAPLLKRRGYKIVANLPYNITSIFLRKFLSCENKPDLMVLMLQKEVAERITARPLKMSLLAVSVQFYAKPEIIEYVKKENFWPMPKVDSAIVKLEVKSSPLRRTGKKLEVDEEKFFQLVKFGFSARRKMLKNNLAAGLKVRQKEVEERIKTAGFNPKIRAQELSLKDWTKIFNIFKCG